MPVFENEAAIVQGRLHQPTTAQRCRSGTEKNILENIFSSEISQFEKYHPSGNLKFNNLSIFQSLKLRILAEKKSFQFPLN